MAKKKFDLVGSIIEFEAGMMDKAGVLKLFSNLIASGMAWSLQGSYGRAAAGLIESGFISKEGKILKEAA